MSEKPRWEAPYRDERNKLIDGEHDYSKSYDKYVLTLSGGALALSVTFLHDIIGDGPVRAHGFIVSAWISFTLSVAVTLLSIHQSAPLYRNFRDILDEKAQNAGDKFSWTDVRTAQSKCKRLKLMDWLNSVSLVLFLLGVILLLRFSSYNLNGATSMTDTTQRELIVARKGMKPALAPVETYPTIVSSGPEETRGKPALAPVEVAQPSSPPAEPAPAQTAPSESAPSQSTGGKD